MRSFEGFASVDFMNMQKGGEDEQDDLWITRHAHGFGYLKSEYLYG